MTTIAVSLISHTNAGKTTLARTLLGEDVGEVADAPHVTTEAASFPLLKSPEGDVLMLWDTPGFGNSRRLAGRLAQQGSPIGWFLSQVWDRFRDRSFFLTQLAVRNVRDHADVAVYLVNAAETPDGAGYLAAEMELLQWIDKPVIVLLNQVGTPHAEPAAADQLEAWHEALKAYPQVREVLALDAFARCWVQEYTLFRRLRRLLSGEKKAAIERLMAAWEAGQWARFHAAMEALAMPIAAAAVARIIVPPQPRFRWLADALGLRGRKREGGLDPAARSRARELMQRLADDQRNSIGQLLAIHGLEGEASTELAALLESDVITRAPIDESQAGLIGGILSGATTGLATDLATGGLTLGGGLLAGTVLGALAGFGIARGVNVVRGETGTSVQWGTTFLESLVTTALLRYLAVAHFGRGRGTWQEEECLPAWRLLVERVVAARQPALAAIWALREGEGVDTSPGTELASELASELAGMARTLLNELYPDVLPSLREAA